MIYAIRQGGDNPGDKPGTTVGHGQGESGAREARAAMDDRYVGRRGDSRRAVQELSHDDAERLRSPDQRRESRHAVDAADRGDAQASVAQSISR